MGVYTFEDEITSPVPPFTLYKAISTDADNIISKAVSCFKGVEILEGNGGPGTIKKLIFAVDGETRFALHKIEAMDEANLEYSYSIIGGTPLPETIEKITIERKIVAGPDGGSIVKLSGKYKTKGDAKPDEEELKVSKTKSDSLFKAIEAYILANP